MLRSPQCSPRWLARAGLLLLVVVLASGCGRRIGPESNRAPLAGTVTFDAKPLPGGSITFVSTEDPRYRVTAMIKPQGEFSVADAPQGAVRVAVETRSILFSGNPAAYVEIPAKYAVPETSGLTIKVGRGQNPPASFHLCSN